MSNDKKTTPHFQIVALYIKDCSFEAPLPISSYKDKQWQPAANVDIKSEHSKLEDKLYEIVLSCKLNVSLEDKTVFIVEMQQAGTFSIDGLDGDKLDHVLSAYCPSIIFPYIRQNISEIITKAGFPALYLSPVDFEAQYFAKKQHAKSD
ncbi:MAG: protein-export chaperone SecB [Legionellales bacterium]|jgi:preprotein translocase subunit SecB|nr:protein-export chaperone SecB [Legionellales bacterium]